MKLQQHVALVGFMGCGKTTIGGELARMLGVAFEDTDANIVAMANMNIPDIFSRHGEGVFRRLETEALRLALDKSPRVIATGGGLIVSETNRKLLLDNAFTVWLHVPWPVLAGRLTDATGERPLLKDDPGLRRTKSLYETRLQYYEAAHMRVEADSPPLAVARAIADRFGTCM